LDNFADRLIKACNDKGSIVCVGIDPRLELLPEVVVRRAFEKHGETVDAAARAFVEFSRRVIDAAAGYAVAVKPQSAFFELLGPSGMQAFLEVMTHARGAGLAVIADVKRSDIGPTAEAYATAFLGRVTIGSASIEPWGADAVTVNPYLGSDGLVPFVRAAAERRRGVFVLVKTSNPSSSEVQDLVAEGGMVYEHVARWVAGHADELMGSSGWSALGAVAGATHPEELGRLRELMPANLILVPGYGAQGAQAADVKPGLGRNGLGAIVNASRSVIFAYREKTWSARHGEERWTDAVAAAARKMRDDLNSVR
jgi:orotidine-5'-phosphate decarboxylase